MNLYNCAQVRQIDEQAIASGIPAYALMQRAALALLRCVRQHWPSAQQLLIVCGAGNNGGDGYELARQAKAAGLAARIWWLTPPDRLRGAAREAADAALADGIPCGAFERSAVDDWLHSLPVRVRDNTVIVDALLGTGASGAPRPAYEDVIGWINGSALPALAVDIPSGVNADTGHVATVAVYAKATLSLIARKQGLHTGDAPSYTGERCFDDLGIPDGIFAQPPGSTPASIGFDASVLTQLPARPRAAHKGDAGRVLVVAGDNGFGGAALMAAEAAARSGAGTVSLMTRPAHVAPMLARCPEVMVHGLDHWEGEAAERADRLLQQASSLVLGPGLGQSPWSHAVLHQVLSRAVQRQIPLVIDADALNMLASESLVWDELAPASVRAQWIITPHPGEAARLLGCSTSTIREDRLAAAQALQCKTGTVVVLKGAGTVIVTSAAGELPEICLNGNPAMATGGMGDVLAGVCGALLALPALGASEAARFAVCAHAEAGDLAAAEWRANRGLLATDLLRWLPGLLSLGVRTS